MDQKYNKIDPNRLEQSIFLYEFRLGASNKQENFRVWNLEEVPNTKRPKYTSWL